VLVSEASVIGCKHLVISSAVATSHAILPIRLEIGLGISVIVYVLCRFQILRKISVLVKQKELLY